MSARHNTEFTCDGCGRTEVEREGRNAPTGWTSITWIGGALGHRDNSHVCSKRCAAAFARKLAEELDPAVEARSSGGPYR